MDGITAAVVLIVTTLFAGLVAFAIRQTGYVKAGGNIRRGSFFFEANDRSRRRD